MSEELSIDGKSYITSKRAAVNTGYTQDYIGQLARSGQIDARRVGGLWYIATDSLNAYKQKADTFKPTPPQAAPYRVQDPETLVGIDGKEYISASRASDVSGYHQDYVGQLARSGKVDSRQIGNRWYVERGKLMAHKSEKDALLAAVQAESVGLGRSNTAEKGTSEDQRAILLNYTSESGDLLPVIGQKEPFSGLPSHVIEDSDHLEPTPIPIHALREEQRVSAPRVRQAPRHRQTRSYAGRAAVAALTIVIVLGIGFTSLNTSGKYALSGEFQGSDGIANVSAAATAILDTLGDIAEKWLTEELVYRQPQGEGRQIKPQEQEQLPSIDLQQ